MEQTKVQRTNKRKIEIDKYGKFEIYGYSPWAMVPVPADDRIPNGGWIITDVQTNKPLIRPLMYNCLVRITDKGARLPVVFSGDSGYEMGSEIVFILNTKL